MAKWQARQVMPHWFLELVMITEIIEKLVAAGFT